MKQQTRKPPKPSSQTLTAPAQVSAFTQQQQRRGKENSSELNRTMNQQTLKASRLQSERQQTPNLQSKQRFKSNGANSQTQKTRPATACLQSKITSPIPLNQTLKTGDRNKTDQQSHVQFEDTSRLLLEQQNQQSKYNSIRKQHQEKQEKAESQITGRKVQQPKLIVHDGFGGESDRQTQSKISPSTRGLFLLHKQKGKASKKAKSQTLSSQNLKSSQSRYKKQQKGLLDFLDSSMLMQQNFSNEDFDNTLKILTKDGKKQSSSADRNKVQMKYLNFHRKNVRPQTGGTANESGQKSRKRSTTTIRNREVKELVEKTIKSTSADKIKPSTSYSPRSKTNKSKQNSNQQADLGVACDFLQSQNKSNQKNKKIELLTKSAVDVIPNGISTILFDKSGLHNESEIFNKQRELQVFGKRSGHDLSSKSQFKTKLSQSPDTRASRIDKIIRDNIKKELIAQEFKKREIREREASSQRRRNMLDQNNKHIRKLNQERVQRRRLKLKDQDSLEVGDSKQLENALLAMNDQPNIDAFESKSSKNQGNRTLNPKSTLQTKIKKVITGDSNCYGRTQGMDFFDVRKEILNEMRQAGVNTSFGRVSKLSTRKGLLDNNTRLLDSALDLQTSKSYRQDQQPADVLKTRQLQQIKQENMLTKREKIRKFMKDKAKLMKTDLHNQKVNEMNTVKKVRCNLTKLNEFVQSKFGHSGITTPALKVVKRKRNQHQQTEQNFKNITPLRKRGQWFEAESLNISAQRRKPQIRDTLNEGDSRLSSIDDRSANKRDKEGKVLSVCFEKSASQKALRKQLRTSNSPQIIGIQKRQASSSSNNKSRPRSALSLSASSKNGQKRKVNPQKSKRISSNRETVSKLHVARGKLVNEAHSAHSSLNSQKNSNFNEDDEVTLNLRFSEKAAATVIQKEVRKYLGSMGFYEARLKNEESPKLYSPNKHHNDGKIVDLFLKPRSQSSKRSQSPVLCNSCSRSMSPNVYELHDPNSNSSVKVEIPSEQLRNIQLFQHQKNQSPQSQQNKDEKHLQLPIQQVRQQSPQSNRHSVSSSLFERNTFREQFSQDKLQALLKDNEYQKLIKMREECVQYREQSELQLIDKAFSEQKITPRAYYRRKEQIEKWVQIQKQEIEQTKIGFKQEWHKTIQMIEQTQKNLGFCKEKVGLSQLDSNSFSQTSRAYQQQQSHRSVLIDDPPKSYRSGKQEATQIKISDVEESNDSHDIDHLINTKLEKQKQSHQRSSSNELEPSDAFINKLERQGGLLHSSQSPSQNTLQIEEHSYKSGKNKTDECGLVEEEMESESEENNDYIDNGFKNQIQDLKKLFAKGDHMQDIDELGSPKSDDVPSQQSQEKSKSPEKSDDVKISDMLKNRDDLKNILNYVDTNKSQEEDQKSSESDTQGDKLTDLILAQIVEECLVLPKRGKQRTPPPALPEPDTSSLMDSVEREEKKEWIEIRQRHLIEATLIRADSYVNELVDVLLQFDISDISENSDFDYGCKPTDNYHIQFLKLLTQPIQRSPLEALELMQKSELGSYFHFETTMDSTKYPILAVDLYLDIEKAREESMRARKATADAKKLQIWESIHILNKCVFDAVNESLMKFRPYGIVGQPMPWSTKVRRLQTKVEIASVDTERLFQMVKQEIFRWSQVFCGCLPGPVFNFPNSKTGKDEFAEDLFQEVRERRLTAILTSDQVEQEHHWLNYEFEEAQVKVDLSDMILETLVSEVIEIMRENEQ